MPTLIYFKFADTTEKLADEIRTEFTRSNPDHYIAFIDTSKISDSNSGLGAEVLVYLLPLIPTRL